MKKHDILKLGSAVLLTVSLGAVGGIITAPEIPNWYAALNKPSFNPPNWIFGPVWTILYILTGISIFLIWKEERAIRP